MNSHNQSNSLLNRVKYLFVGLVTIALLTSCGGGGGGGGSDNVDAGDVEPPSDYSGTWYVAIGHSPRFVMEITLDSGNAAFSLDGSNLQVTGTGLQKNNTMTLKAELGELGKFDGKIVFQDDSEEFLGEWQIEGPNLISGTLAGQRTAWSLFDPDSSPLPQFVDTNCIDLDKITKISRFRSGAGHDYSDDFESCRSMKHYFQPEEGSDYESIRIFSPVDGTIVGITDEWQGQELYKGTVVGIQPDGHRAFSVALFHIDLNRGLNVGDRVVAGQELGTSAKLSGTATEISIEAHTPGGVKLVSFFEAMSAALFDQYRSRGVPSRQATIISKAERDADPLTCDGQIFLDSGSLENYIDLADK
jgi:hypothetical protein